MVQIETDLLYIVEPYSAHCIGIFSSAYRLYQLDSLRYAGLLDQPDMHPVNSLKLKPRSISWPCTQNETASVVVRGIEIDKPMTTPFDTTLGQAESPWVSPFSPLSALAYSSIPFTNSSQP